MPSVRPPTAHPSPHPIDGAPPSLAVAGRVIDALAARDFDLLARELGDDVGFRALLPSRVLEVRGAGQVRDAFDRWFGHAERWEMVEAVVGEVGGRLHLRWRVQLSDPAIGAGSFVVEQQVYADSDDDGRLSDVSLMCTGYRPVPT
jgi:hypothetical protein